MSRIIYPYKPYLVKLAREFRNNPTRSEKRLWERLKGKRVRGFDFHRQKPIGYYILDFFCHELCLAIEIDGDVHLDEGRKMKDEIRQDEIEQFGIRFLRFTSKEVMIDTNQVIKEIECWIDQWIIENKIKKTAAHPLPPLANAQATTQRGNLNP